MASRRKFSTKLIGQEFDKRHAKYGAMVPAKNGKIYLVPDNAKKVKSFNPQTNELKEIGDDLGDGGDKWAGAVLASDGKIYCAPYESNNILVVDTSTESTTLIPLPDEVGRGQYNTCAADKIGYVYFFPRISQKIFKINIANNKISIVNVDCGSSWNDATLVSNGHIFVVPNGNQNYIMDFDPNEESITKIHSPSIKYHNPYSQLVEHRDGNLYAISECNTIKINVATLNVSEIKHELERGFWADWTGPVIGNDGCIYVLSYHNNRVVRHDTTNQTTISSGIVGDGSWFGMCIGKDGNGYCAPFNARQILKICIPRGNWPYLKYRLLIENNRATAKDLSQEEENYDGLTITQKFLTYTNDDEFRYTLGFF